MEVYLFIIVFMSLVEFVILLYDGFILLLYMYVKNNFGGKLWVFVDGFYGLNFDLRKFDKMVFVVGGLGVMFILGIM